MKGTFALLRFILQFLWGYHLAKTYEVNRFAGSAASLVAFAMSISDSVKLHIDGDVVDTKMLLISKQFSTMGLFTAIILAVLEQHYLLHFIRLELD